MQFDPTPALNTKHRWSLCRSGSLNQQPEPEFLDEIGSRKPDRSPSEFAAKHRAAIRDPGNGRFKLITQGPELTALWHYYRGQVTAEEVDLEITFCEMD